MLLLTICGCKDGNRDTYTDAGSGDSLTSGRVLVVGGRRMYEHVCVGEELFGGGIME